MTTQMAIISSGVDQNDVREEEIHVAPAYVPEKFRLIVGMPYVMQCKELVQIVYENKANDQFLGVWESKEGPQQFWFTSEGFVTDEDRENIDPFDIKRLHRDPDTIYLLRKDGAYTSNNCFTSLESAQTAAAERGGRVVPFQEVMEE